MEELSYVFLDHEDWPEWFTLDFLPVTGTAAPQLLLGVAESLLHQFLDILSKYRLLDVYKECLKEYGIETEFLLDIDKPWGFGGVLKPYRQSGRVGAGTLVYAISIPQIEKEVGKCEECGGNGDKEDWECHYCMGTGIKITMEWDVIDRIAATLCVLGDIFLDKPDKEWLARIDAKKKQLLSVQTSFQRGGAYIGATLARPFGDYLRSISMQELPEVTAATKSVYLHMFPRYKRFSGFDFRAYVRDNGQLIIDVPGNACGLYVDGFDHCLKENSGPMKLSCHNVDGHHQQLTLLSGLAALSGMVRRKLYPE